MKKTDSFPKTRIQTLGVDPISLSRELLFQGTIRKPKHRRNVFMAGTEYFGETAQPRDHIPVNTMRKSHNRDRPVSVKSNSGH